MGVPRGFLQRKPFRASKQILVGRYSMSPTKSGLESLWWGWVVPMNDTLTRTFCQAFEAFDVAASSIRLTILACALGLHAHISRAVGDVLAVATLGTPISAGEHGPAD